MDNLEKLISVFNLSNEDIQNLKSYNDNNRKLLFKFISNERNYVIFLYGYYEGNDEFKGLCGFINNGEFIGEVGTVDINDLINMKIDVSFQEIYQNDFRYKKM